jgi:hypothetical protein
MNQHLAQALCSLRPNVEWTLPGDEILANVIWPEGIDPPSQAEVSAEIERLEALSQASKRYAAAKGALTDHLNKLALSWEYGSYDRAGIYCTSKNPKYRAEAQAIIDYGSDCFTVSDEIRAGRIAEPQTVEAFMALMPALPQRPVVE